MAAGAGAGTAGSGTGAGAAGGGQGMNNLTTLIKRLEAATSRLEDIASSASTFDARDEGLGAAAVGAGNPAPELPSMAAHTSPPPTAAPPAVELPATIGDMDELIDKEVKAYLDTSKSMDPLVQEQATAVARAFAGQRRFLLVSTRAKRPEPSSDTFMVLLSDLQQDIGTVGDIKDSNRRSPVFELLAMVGEGTTAFQWLLRDGKPADFVGEVIGSAQYHGNRVLKAYRERASNGETSKPSAYGDESHVKYVQAYYALLKALQAYIKKNYSSGVSWNSSGIDASQAFDESFTQPAPVANGVTVASPTQSAPPASGAPPPPSPPPLPNFDNVPPPPPGPAPQGAKSGSDMGAVFDQLNRGESVTSGLKKVDKSQMTHKNPSLRASSTVPEAARSRSPGGPEVKPKPASMRQNSSASVQSRSTSSTVDTKKRPPKKELDGNKWLIENHDSPSQPITINVELNHSILITRCTNTTIIVRGKANALSIDNSPKTQILVDTLISGIDVIKCPGFAVQVTGSLPTIMLDQTDGASIYLDRDSMGTEVFTSKCSGVNIVLPPESEAEDSTEHALPEQIRTVVKGGRLISEIVEHAG